MLYFRQISPCVLEKLSRTIPNSAGKKTVFLGKIEGRVKDRFLGKIEGLCLRRTLLDGHVTFNVWCRLRSRRFESELTSVSQAIGPSLVGVSLGKNTPEHKYAFTVSSHVLNYNRRVQANCGQATCEFSWKHIV